MSPIHIIPTLEDNYTYAVQSDREVILIDCGEAGPVIDFLTAKNLTPTNLLCTHHHGDHIAGIPDLEKKFPELKVHLPEGDILRIPGNQNGLHDGQILTIGGNEVHCIETPGHTKNHLCYFLPKLNAVFTGDALFSMGCGRLFEGSAEDLFDSMQKLKELPEETLIYCGHEYTLKNAEFCLSIEPANQDIQKRKQEAEALQQENKPTLPVSLAKELKTNLFLMAETVEKIAQLRQLRDKF